MSASADDVCGLKDETWQLAALDLLQAAQWGSGEPIEALEVFPASEIHPGGALEELVLPRAVPNRKHELARRRQLAGPFRLQSKHLVRIRDGIVETRMCVAITPDGRYVSDSVRTVRQAEENGYRFATPTLVQAPGRRSVSLDAPAVLVGAPVANNYFHWIFEALARPLSVAAHLPKGAVMLVPKLTDMAQETLLNAGLPEGALYEMPADSAMRVRDLYVPPRGLDGGARLHPAAATALHALAPDSCGGGSHRLYVSRASARWRRVANERAVVNALRPLGFQVVEMERLSFREQMALCASAEVVVSAHGAGLTNVVFCPEGALVVELQAPELDDARISLYWCLSTIRGLRYIQVVSPYAPDQEGKPIQQRDIVVDIDALQRSLARHLGDE